MKLLNEIVELLMNEAGSLDEALLKTKVLLHQIGQKELVGWVNSELVGYGPTDDLPDYRAIRARLFGHITNGFYTHTNIALPVAHLTKNQLTYLEGNGMRQGLGVLEKLIADTKASNSLARPISPERYALLSKPLDGDYHVQRAWAQIETSQLRQILTQVRSRLLDFILELREEVGMQTPDKDIKKMTSELDVPGMFGRSVFGDNTTIVVGNHNHQRVINTAIKHDKEALAAELRRHGVSVKDIKALDVALDSDPHPTQSEQYGPAVQGWMKRMLGKAIDNSWDVSVGAAGSLLATAIQRYYGF